MIQLAAVLIAAHGFADFFLQTEALSRRKRRFNFLLLHGLIHGGLTYVVLQAWTLWQAPLLVLMAHTSIDLVKIRLQNESARAFLLDQAVHVASLLGLAWLLVDQGWLPAFTGVGYQPLIAVAGLTTTVYGAGHLIGKVAVGLTDKSGLILVGLPNGGRFIGQLERALIFLLIFIDHPGGIGFLVAAKSILRFEEAKEQKLAEYVLIGTLMSFCLAIALSTLTRWAMNL